MNINLLVLFDRPIFKGYPKPHFSSIEFETADGQHLSMDLYFCKQEISEESNYHFSVNTDIGYTDDNNSENDVLLHSMDKICAIRKLIMDFETETMARPVGILMCNIFMFSREKIAFQHNDLINIKANRSCDKYFYDFVFSDRLLSTCHFDEIYNLKTLTVEFNFSMDVDVSDIDPECADIIGLAKELALRELHYGIDNSQINEMDLMITDLTKKDDTEVLEQCP